MSQAPNSLPGHISGRMRRPNRWRWRWSAVGIFAGFISLAAYSQMQWAEANGHAHLIPRLAAAALAGGGAGWLFTRLVRRRAQRHGQAAEPSLRRWSYSLAFTVLILFTHLYHPLLFAALLLPIAAYLVIGAARGLKARGAAHLKPMMANLALVLGGLVAAAALGEFTTWLIYHDFPYSGYRSPNMVRVAQQMNPHHRPGFSARGPGSLGPKPPGVTRVLVQGDSVTSGAQIDWREGIPNQLLQMLNQDGPTHWQMDVIARPGREMLHHYHNLARIGRQPDPDVVVYIWYVNDLETTKKGRPHSRAVVWRHWPTHSLLRKHSYFYRLLDTGLENLLPRMAPTYLEYLAENFKPSTPKWFIFDLYFHMYLDRAGSIAPRTIVYLYPALPRFGLQGQPYSLGHIHRQVMASAKRDYVSWAAWLTPHAVGQDQPDRTATSKVVRLVHRGVHRGALMVDGPMPRCINLLPGEYKADFRLKASTPELHGPSVLVRAVAGHGRVLASQEVSLDHAEPGGWRTVTLPFRVGPQSAHDVRLQVQYLGGEVAVDRLSLHWPHRGRVEVIDGAPELRELATWNNQFDGHPNTATNTLVARALAKAIIDGDHRYKSVGDIPPAAALDYPAMMPLQ